MATTVYDDKTANELAGDAAESIRGLNHLTRDAGSLHYPSDVYRVLGSLQSLAGRLPQALTQMERLLHGWVEDDHVSIDAGEVEGDPSRRSPPRRCICSRTRCRRWPDCRSRLATPRLHSAPPASPALTMTEDGEARWAKIRAQETQAAAVVAKHVIANSTDEQRQAALHVLNLIGEAPLDELWAKVPRDWLGNPLRGPGGKSTEEWVTWSLAANIKDGAQGAWTDLRRVIATGEADPA